MLDVKTKLKEVSRKIKPETLVRHEDGSVGLVVLVTRKWVHVVWLVNANPGLPESTKRSDQGGHHFLGLHERSELTNCPPGTTVTITQVNN